jgi:hypothetical protein
VTSGLSALRCLAALTCPLASVAGAQTTDTTCRQIGGVITCRSTSTPPYSAPPPIQQVDVSSALRTYAAAREAANARRLEEEAREAQSPLPQSAPSSSLREEALVAFDAWREANPWYDRGGLVSATELEKDARIYADRMTDRYIDRTASMRPAAFFALIGNLVDERYPQLKHASAR